MDFQQSDVTKCAQSMNVTEVNLTEPTTGRIEVIENSSTTLRCITSSLPRATITWYKESSSGEETALTDNVYTSYTTIDNGLVRSDSTLVFTPKRNDLNSSIFCKATNTNGTEIVNSTQTVILDVFYAPEGPLNITDHINGSTIEVIENNTISLTCFVKGGNPRPTLWWTCQSDSLNNDNAADETRLRLQWRAVRNNDGPCRCSSYHPTLPTNQSVWIDIQVFYPPSIPAIIINGTERKGSVKVINNTVVPLSCQSSGRPTPQLRWQYSGQQIDGSSTTITVTRNSTATCTANNTLPGSIKNSSETSIDFHMIYGPTKPNLFCTSTNSDHIIGDQNINIIKGDNLTLICVSEADPLPSYYWNSQEGQNITFDVAQQGTNVFNCSAKSMLIPDYGPTKSMVSWSSVDVNILYVPTIRPSLTYAITPGPTGDVVSSFSVVENTTFSITCDSSDGKPSPTYEWIGGTSTGGKLEITSIKRSTNIDSNGISYYSYTCTARNTMTNTCGDKRTEIGTTNRTTRINVLYPASIQTMTNRSVVEGNTSIITVLVNSHGSPRESYIWYHETDVVQHGPNYTMKNTSRTQAGTYTIKAVNNIRPTGMDAYNSSVRQSFYLDVFYTSSVSSFTLNNQQNSITVNENDTVTLQCIVDSNPVSDVFIKSSTHNGDVELTRQYLNDITHTVHTTCYDTGTYRCYGQNDYTDLPASSQTKQLLVLCTPRPRFTVEHNITYNKALNTSVDLNLTWFAYPEPSSDSLQWTRLINKIWVNVTNGENTNITTAGLESRLYIQSLQQSDFGQYRLSIQYNERSYYQLFFIGPQDKPQSPMGFLHVDKYLNQTSAVFRWTPGFDGGLEQTFIILYQQQGRSQWTERAVSHDNDNITIVGLSAGTVYLVKMFANNSIGRSSDTETLEITTKEYPVSKDNEDNIGIIAGAAGGGGLAVILIVVGLIFIYFCKRRKSGEKSDQRKSLYRDEPIYDENGMQINLAYDSIEFSGTRPQLQQPSTSVDVYAQVDKTKKELSVSDDNAYAVVDKSKKTDEKNQGQADLYATPIKKKSDDKKQERNAKKDKKKKIKKAKANDVYENAQELNIYNNVGSLVGDDGVNIYDREQQPTPKRNLNKDGLLYADLEFNNNKGQRKLVIHGLENATEYIQVDFTKKADPLPDSDEEGDNV